MSIADFRMPVSKNSKNTFTVKNLETKRTYQVEGHENSTRKSVWDSQKCFFSMNTRVEVTSPDGFREIFCR